MLEASVVIDIGPGVRAVVRWYDDGEGDTVPRIYVYDASDDEDEEEPVFTLDEDEWKKFTETVGRATAALHGGL